MRHYKPREIIDGDGHPTGKFHMTCSAADRIYPVGYCAGEPRIETGFLLKEEVEMWNKKAAPWAAHFHDNGHDTPKEAASCYYRYELDIHMRRFETANLMERCLECGAFTTWVTEVHGRFERLCGDHQGREYVETWFRPAMEWWAS